MKKHKTQTREEAFWSKLNKDGPTISHMDSPCWIWSSCKDMNGYGRFNINRTTISAHRASWILHNGPIPHGLFICHRCDNPSCVNPSHLFLGTHADNMRDMQSKGRGVHPRGDKNGSRMHPQTRPRGDRHSQAKLTAAQVIEIRAAYAAGGVRQRDLALRFCVSGPQINLIINRKKWKHIP